MSSYSDRAVCGGCAGSVALQGRRQEIVLNVKGTESSARLGRQARVLQLHSSGAIDARFIPAVIKGLMEKMEEGPLTGSYARDIRVALYDGKMHPVDSNEISFKLAARNAFKEAFRNAGPKIMEPIYIWWKCSCRPIAWAT